MKTQVLLLLLFVACSLHAQLAQLGQANVPPEPPRLPREYSITAQTADSRTWEHIIWHTNGPHIFARTNRYNEIVVGLHYRGPKGEWLESSDQIEIQPTGGALAAHGRHQTYFPGDLYGDALRATLPDGKVLSSRPIGLAFADPGRSVLIAELKPGSTGQLLPSGSQVLYTNICTDIRCDLLVSHNLAGVESEVVLREQLPDPRAFGFSNNVVLQWWTEWFDAPVPDKEVRVLAGAMTDEFLHFGEYKMVNGKAFLFGNEASSNSRIPVMKHWVTISNRVCLVEEVPLPAVASSLKSLPGRTAQLQPNRKPGGKPARTAYNPLLPAQRVITRSAKALQLARNDVERPGFSLDWSLLSGPLTNYTFTGDSTTLIRGSVALYGTTTIEGGAVIKFSNNVANSGSLVIYGPLSWKTGPYRLAALTSINDDNVGDIISGSTGNPTTAGPLLPALDLEGNGSAVTWQLNFARFSYFSDGGCIGFDGSNIVVRSCQFVKCGYGVVTAVPIGKPAGNISVYNALFTGCAYPIWCDQYAIAENVTAVGYTNFCGADQFPLGLAVTNSILAGSGSIIPPWNDPDNPCPLTPVLDHTTTNSSSAGLFQQVGGGAFYLVDGSTNRNSGTTAIDTNLLAELRKKTTYPPVVVSNTYLGPADVNLSPQAQRDIDQIDRGWEYDPLDYCFGAVEVTNCNFIVAPGTAIGGFGTTNATWALTINNNANISCQGTPTAPVWVAEYSQVQEQTNVAWRMPNYALIVDDGGSTGDLYADCRFVDFSCFAEDTCLLAFISTSNSIRDCQFYSGYSVYYFGPIGITNCLFYRHMLYLQPTFNYEPAALCNSLFWGGDLEFSTETGTNGVIRDNLFDRPTINFNDGSYGGGYNAYITNFARINPHDAHDIILTNTDYRTGPLGTFYYPTNGGMLSTLINHGSTNANLLGLYHYTVMTNLISGLEIKETNSIVDIGFHYVATDSNGNPIDTDGDGTPDYAEDLNGNGSVDSGETDWQNAADLGLSVHITHPARRTDIP